MASEDGSKGISRMGQPCGHRARTGSVSMSDQRTESSIARTRSGCPSSV